MTTSFAERILQVHEALAVAEVRHGFGGAVALAYYVLEPRTTRDIDINISVPTESAATVLQVLPDGIEIEEKAIGLIRRDGQIRLWWDGRDGIPVDLFFPQHAFHTEVDRDVKNVPFLNTEIPIISATHLTVFKVLFNRPRDWPDIEAMLEAGSVDVSAALAWGERLLGSDAPPFMRLSALAAEVASPSGQRVQTSVDWRKLGP